MEQEKWSIEQEKRLISLWMQGLSKRKIAREMGKTFFSIKRKLRRLQDNGKALQREAIDFSRQETSKRDEININENGISCRFVENHPLSIDEIWEKFKLSTTEKVNIDDYEVYNIKVESWDVTIKQKDGSARAYRNYLTDVRFRLKKLEVLTFQEDKKQLLDICKNYSPKMSVIKYAKNKDPKMLEIGIYDPHYGKLSLIDKTGETASLEGASIMVKNAVIDLVGRTRGYNIEKIVFPIGNDWSHINNAEGTTRRGTQQEYTNYLFQIRRKCKEDLIWAIKYLLQFAPVDIIQVPGNHDEDVILTVAEILEAYFHNDKNVFIDTSPQLRKSIVYGKNFIGFTHGDSKDIRVDRLPLVFASEEKQKWASTTFQEIHLGHIHFKKEQTFIVGDEFNGIRIRWIPSLASADSWHYRHGYVKSRKSAEAFIWDKEHGCIGNFAINVRMK